MASEHRHFRRTELPGFPWMRTRARRLTDPYEVIPLPRLRSQESEAGCEAPQAY